MTGNPRFAWDCRRRFIENYASIVLGLGTPQGSIAQLAKAVADARIKRRSGPGWRSVGAPSRVVPGLGRKRRLARRPDAATRGGGARRLWLLDERTRADIPAPAEARSPAGNGCDGAGYGVRESRPVVWGRRSVLTRSFDWVGAPAGGCAVRCSGRGSGFGMPHPANRGGARVCAPHVADELHGILGRLERDSATFRTSSSRSRRAGFGFCRLGRPSAHRSPRCGLRSILSTKE